MQNRGFLLIVMVVWCADEDDDDVGFYIQFRFVSSYFPSLAFAFCMACFDHPFVCYLLGCLLVCLPSGLDIFSSFDASIHPGGAGAGSCRCSGGVLDCIMKEEIIILTRGAFLSYKNYSYNHQHIEAWSRWWLLGRWAGKTIDNGGSCVCIRRNSFCVLSYVVEETFVQDTLKILKWEAMWTCGVAGR